MGIMGRPRKFKTVEEFATAIQSYFDMVAEKNAESLKKTNKLCKVPNMANLCSHIGIAKVNFYEYAKRTDDDGNSFKAVSTQATQYVEGFKLEAAALGQIKEITTIFDLKNNHGYSDKMEVNNITQSEPLAKDSVHQLLKDRRKEKQSQNTNDTGKLVELVRRK